jgi:hypothetical protein
MGCGIGQTSVTDLRAAAFKKADKIEHVKNSNLPG